MPRALVRPALPRGPHHQILSVCGLLLLNSDHYTQSDARTPTTDYWVFVIPGRPCSNFHALAVFTGAPGFSTNGTLRYSAIQSVSVTLQRT